MELELYVLLGSAVSHIVTIIPHVSLFLSL